MTSPSHTLNISEIFHSIQGESTRAGEPCVFVRLTACDLRCVWCDTAYAFDGGERMSIDAIVAQVRKFSCRLVEITGGEPLLQAEVHDLMSRLCDDGHEVLVETGGHLDIGRIDDRVSIIMDIKCPGSGMQAKNRMENLAHLKPSDEVKFVIADRDDYEWAKNMLQTEMKEMPNTVLFSPVFGKLENSQLSEWILRDMLPVRFQVQLHKYIWEPSRRGV
jgi:7-carboxy-7-deazaguanine synthase